MNLYYLHKGQMSFEVKFGSKKEEIYKTHVISLLNYSTLTNS